MEERLWKFMEFYVKKVEILNYIIMSSVALLLSTTFPSLVWPSTVIFSQSGVMEHSNKIVDVTY